ncbi:ATP-binding cassette sub-family A member 7-like, partial [Hyposmocoma kahamanoa]|uniref:ATP-binding cassette sub-family A member 7-like n=1 Tax=Hyposmocoma kahamanoa TaxID=1477025 RepID=UPI000E6D72AF
MVLGLTRTRSSVEAQRCRIMAWKPSNRAAQNIPDALQQRPSPISALNALYCILPAIASILDDSGFNIRFSVILYDIPIWTSEIFMPPHAALLAFYRGGRSAQWNAQCALNMCNGTQQLNDACCKQRNPECYFCIDSGKPGAPLLILLLQTCLYMIFVLLAQHGYLNQWRDKLVNMKYVRPQKHYNDKMVLAEESYVSKNIALSQAQATDAMLIGDVHKNYVSIGCGHVKKCNAVKGVSFSVKRGECFGVLGVNGAGKSSTFRTITSEDHATRGQVFANRHCLTLCHRQQYLLSLGYCRQFFGLDLFLSGWDNLALLLKLRGWSGDTITKEVDIWIKAVGLERYAKERVCFYNRDCKRRLAAAAALAQGAPVTLLDEPTAGVDATTRRYVWRALRRGQALGRTIIMTSH